MSTGTRSASNTPPPRSPAAPATPENDISRPAKKFAPNHESASDLFYRYPAAPAETTVAQPVEEKPAEKPVVDLVEELEKLRGEGLITAEEAKWLESIYLEFRLLPHAALSLKDEKILTRIRVLKKLQLDITRVRESWISEHQLDPERAGKLPPPSYVAKYLAERAIELKLIEPVLLELGEEVEYGLRVGRKLYFEETLKKAVHALAGAGEPLYVVRQLFTTLLDEVKLRAKEVPRGSVDPLNLLNTESGVVDLDTLELVDTDAVFTYELPAVNPTFLERLKRGEVTEEYFAGQAFYQVLRKHYSAREWEKLKAVLGATIVPVTMRLIAIIVGEPSTRKTFLFSLIRKTLRRLAASVSLRELEDYRFALQHAMSARALLCSEEAHTVVHSVEALKRLSGGDPIAIYRKHLPTVERVDNPYKIYIFSNALPSFRRVDEAFVERLVIIQAENPRQPDAEERALIEKALQRTGDFLEFILWCYWQLRRNNYAIPEKGDTSYMSMLHEAQSNVFSFLEELMKEDGLILGGRKYIVFFEKTAKIDAAQFYDVYVEWCHRNGEKPQGRNTFYQRVVEAWGGRVVKVRGEKGVEFRGVKLIERSMQDTEL